MFVWNVFCLIGNKTRGCAHAAVMSTLETDADVEIEQETSKRKVQLTAKALSNKIEQLQKERKRKVNEIKSVIPKIKKLMLRN